MAIFQAQHYAAVEDVRRAFAIPHDESVIKFLDGHRTIPQLLIESVTALKASFGEATIFNLRTRLDEAGSEILYAVAMSAGTSRSAYDALTAFDESWWLRHVNQASGNLVFTYELV